MMPLVDTLKNLILELDRTHPNGSVDYDKLDKRVIPTFRRAETGAERYFTDAALEELLVITDALYKGTNGLSQRVLLEEYSTIVQQAVVDCHVTGEFDLIQHEVEDCKAFLKNRITAAVAALKTTFTHYFPAWTLGVEQSKKFVVGPVTFLTRDQWIASVKFSDKAIRATSPRKGHLFDWKLRLRALLEGKGRKSKNSSLHDWVYRAIKDCPSVLKVRVSGSVLSMSRQQARYACRTALDCVALLFDDDSGKRHRQFVLADERLTPIGESTLVESKGNLWFPGSSFHPRGWMGDPLTSPLVKSAKVKKYLSACGKIIKALLNPATCATPRLAQRWAVALSVFAEGCREVQDGLAIAKLCSSLDILSGGGKEKGILALVLHQTGANAKDVLVKLPQPLTFEKVVERIYKHGRSQFLHGNHIDPMMRFTDEREHATFLARCALRASVLRWSKYTGVDDDKAFQTM